MFRILADAPSGAARPERPGFFLSGHALAGGFAFPEFRPETAWAKTAAAPKHNKDMKTAKKDKTETAPRATKGALPDIVEYNKKVISSWLERSGAQTASIRSVGPEYATIRITEPNYNCVSGKACVFSICFGKKDFDKARSPRWVRIDLKVLDPFGKDDKLEMERLRLVMFFAEHLDDLEKELVGTPESKKLYGAWTRARDAMFGAPGELRTRRGA